MRSVALQFFEKGVTGFVDEGRGVRVAHQSDDRPRAFGQPDFASGTLEKRFSGYAGLAQMFFKAMGFCNSTFISRYRIGLVPGGQYSRRDPNIRI